MEIIEVILRDNSYISKSTGEPVALPRVSHLIGGSTTPFNPSPAMQRGTNIHDILARYITGKISAGYLKEMAGVDQEYNVALAMLKSLQTHLEGVDYTYSMTELSFGVEYEDGRGYLGTVDLVLAIRDGDSLSYVLVDWKTGDKSPKHISQVEFYCNALSAKKGLIVYEGGDIVEVDRADPSIIKEFVDAFFVGMTKGGNLTEQADLSLNSFFWDYFMAIQELEEKQKIVDNKKNELEALLSEKNITQVGTHITAHYQPPKVKKILKKEVLSEIKKELEKNDENMLTTFSEGGWLFKINKNKEKDNDKIS